MNTNTSTSVGSLTSLEGSLLAEEAGLDTRCVPSPPSLFGVSSLACSPPLRPRASQKPTSSVSAFHALPLPPPTFRSPPVWWEDGLELTEEVIDTPGLGGLADTEEVPIGLPSTTHPSLVVRLPIFELLPPAYQVSPATEHVAMSPPMPAHQVNVTSAAVHAVPSLLSASEEEATSAMVYVASVATVQVQDATHQLMSASDDEVTQAPVQLALFATVQVATSTLIVYHFPWSLRDSGGSDIIMSHGLGPLEEHKSGGVFGRQYGCIKYGGEYVSTTFHRAKLSSVTHVPSNDHVYYTRQVSVARGSGLLHSPDTVLPFDDCDVPSTRRTETILPSDIWFGRSPSTMIAPIAGCCEVIHIAPIAGCCEVIHIHAGIDAVEWRLSAHVSSTTEHVAMPSPMLAHQVNTSSAALQAAPSLMSASEEEATSAPHQVAPRVTLQVTTHPMSASVEEATSPSPTPRQVGASVTFLDCTLLEASSDDCTILHGAIIWDGMVLAFPSFDSMVGHYSACNDTSGVPPAGIATVERAVSVCVISPCHLDGVSVCVISPCHRDGDCLHAPTWYHMAVTDYIWVTYYCGSREEYCMGGGTCMKFAILQVPRQVLSSVTPCRLASFSKSGSKMGVGYTYCKYELRAPSRDHPPVATLGVTTPSRVRLVDTLWRVLVDSLASGIEYTWLMIMFGIVLERIPSWYRHGPTHVCYILAPMTTATTPLAFRFHVLLHCQGTSPFFDSWVCRSLTHLIGSVAAIASVPICHEVAVSVSCSTHDLNYIALFVPNDTMRIVVPSVVASTSIIWWTFLMLLDHGMLARMVLPHALFFWMLDGIAGPVHYGGFDVIACAWLCKSGRSICPLGFISQYGGVLPSVSSSIARSRDSVLAMSTTHAPDLPTKSLDLARSIVVVPSLVTRGILMSYGFDAITCVWLCKSGRSICSLGFGFQYLLTNPSQIQSSYIVLPPCRYLVLSHELRLRRAAVFPCWWSLVSFFGAVLVSASHYSTPSLVYDIMCRLPLPSAFSAVVDSTCRFAVGPIQDFTYTYREMVTTSVPSAPYSRVWDYDLFPLLTRSWVHCCHDHCVSDLVYCDTWIIQHEYHSFLVGCSGPFELDGIPLIPNLLWFVLCSSFLLVMTVRGVILSEWLTSTADAMEPVAAVSLISSNEFLWVDVLLLDLLDSTGALRTYATTIPSTEVLWLSSIGTHMLGGSSSAVELRCAYFMKARALTRDVVSLQHCLLGLRWSITSRRLLLVSIRQVNVTCQRFSSRRLYLSNQLVGFMWYYMEAYSVFVISVCWVLVTCAHRWLVIVCFVPDVAASCRSSSRPHRCCTNVVPPRWYVEVLRCLLSSIHHSRRYSRIGSVEDSILVVALSLSREPVWIVLYGSFVELPASRCSKWVEYLSSLISWLCQGSSMSWTDHLMPSWYLATSLLDLLCQWFRWFCIAIFSWWWLTQASQAGFPCTSRPSKSQLVYDHTCQLSLLPSAVFASMWHHVLESRRDFTSDDRNLLLTSVSYAFSPRVCTNNISHLISCLTSISKDVGNGSTFAVELNSDNSCMKSHHQNGAIASDKVGVPWLLVRFPIGNAGDNTIETETYWRFLMSNERTGLIDDVVELVLLGYIGCLVYWALPDVMPLALIVDSIDQSLPQCSGWNDMVFLRDHYINRPLTRCNEWTKKVLPRRSVWFDRFESIFDSFLLTYYERIALIIMLVKLVLQICNKWISTMIEIIVDESSWTSWFCKSSLLSGSLSFCVVFFPSSLWFQSMSSLGP